ncbi:hypothetical protein PV328_008975 [Microctonus aethiopoides]|uniref:Ig-like domain-containing protein n=1 Tax=Microctonus aethiopoides TaxID=144406 RepID=A0AA39FKD9_9HYME|nr:hypothetical protein PV328_008975 [Microctonus aethiopoides]
MTATIRSPMPSLPLTPNSFNAAPAFLRPVGNQTAAIGREAVFSCYVRNIGKYKAGGCSSTPGIPMGIYSVSGSNQVMDEGVNCTWRLHIRHLKKSDEGCYMCQINTDPMIAELGCLDILGKSYIPPDIVYGDETSKDLSVSEGENVTLNCQATGTPKPRSYNFQRLEIYNESKLHFYRVDRQQMGVYMCIASNDVPPTVSKRVTLEVNFAPTVQVRSQLLGAPLGTRVQLECSIEAHPNTINFWERNRTEMLLDGPRYEVHEERSGYQVDITLVIKKFTEQDVGTYVCIATNSLGRAEGTSRLYKINLTDDVSIIGAGLAEAARGSRSPPNTRPGSLIFISLGAIPLLIRAVCSR